MPHQAPQPFTSFDLTRVSQPIPEGVHLVKLTDVQEKMGGSGFPYLLFTAEAMEDQPWNGQKVWITVSLAPQAAFFREKFLDAVDAPTSGKASGKDFLGVLLKVRVKHESIEDEYGEETTRVSVEDYYPADKKVSGSSKSSMAELAKKAKAKKSEEEDNSGLPEDVIE